VSRLCVVALGGNLRGWAREARDDYLRRMPRGYEIACAPKVPRGARVIALDERGEAMDSFAFSRKMQFWMGEKTALAFVIGGPDGLDEKVKAQASFLLRLSSLTLPHALAEVVLVEQLYRAATLLTGHPYHRG